MQDSQHCLGLAEVSEHPLLSDFKPSRELMSRFIERAVIMTYPRDKVLFRVGEAASRVYLILNGEVELLLPLNKQSAIPFRADYGSLIGVPAAYGSSPYSMMAVVSKRTELAELGRQEFCKLVLDTPSFAMDVLKTLAAETLSARLAIRTIG